MAASSSQADSSSGDALHKTNNSKETTQWAQLEKGSQQGSQQAALCHCLAARGTGWRLCASLHLTLHAETMRNQQSPLKASTGRLTHLYVGSGSCGVMSMSGSAINPLWLASITLLRGITVAMSLTCATPT
jgi:hypothetical protein